MIEARRFHSSFFYIYTKDYIDFQNFEDNPPEVKGTFIHEYCHYLQDVSTTFAIYVLQEGKDQNMNADTLLFFDKHMDALPIYEAFEEQVMKEIDNVRVKVQKSQISFYNKHLLACVSFAGVKKKKDCPPAFIVVTLGLNHRVDSPRIDIATEPYPNRWTHHLLLADRKEVDEELMVWVREAAAFSDAK